MSASDSPVTVTDLPRPVTAALDQVEAGLPTVPRTDDSARRALEEQVAQYLDQHARDPISRALLSRVTVFRWCLAEVVTPSTPPRPTAARVADPLVSPPAEPATAPDPTEPDSTAPDPTESARPGGRRAGRSGTKDKS